MLGPASMRQGRSETMIQPDDHLLATDVLESKTGRISANRIERRALGQVVAIARAVDVLLPLFQVIGIAETAAGARNAPAHHGAGHGAHGYGCVDRKARFEFLANA